MDLTIDMLLSKRDYDYLAFTRKILDLFADKLSKAVQMQFKFDRGVNWESVERFRAVDRYVIVKGEAELRPGDTLNTPEGPVLITEENLNQWRHPLRYVLDSKVLQNGTLEDLYQHITCVAELARELPEAELIHALRSGAINNHDMMGNPVLAPILERITRPSVFESFDTHGLTEEQYNSLRLCANIGKTTQQN